MNEGQDQKEEELVKLLPSIQYFDRMYGASFEGNDRKAVHTFKNYEPREKVRRLQGELQAVKNSKVALHICDLAIGKKRLQKHQSYEHWAGLMLQWLSQKQL